MSRHRFARRSRRGGRMRRGVARLAATVAVAGIAGIANAQSWPQRPITLISPTTSGTAADIAARTLAPRLSQQLGRPIVVENRTGASGNIGVTSVVKAAPDGHTLLVGPNTLGIIPLVIRDLGWDPLKDLQPVARMARMMMSIVVHPSVNAQTASELVALARQKPGVLNYASPGNGTPHHLAMELFKQITSTDFTHIPYKGSAGAVTDLIGGRVETAFFPVHAVAPHVRAGKLRMVGSVGTSRTPWTPEVPTLDEQGIRGVDVDSWIGLFAPVGTPADVVARLNQELGTLLAQTDTRETLFQQGVIANHGSPDDLLALLKGDLDRYRPVVAKAKIAAD